MALIYYSNSRTGHLASLTALLLFLVMELAAKRLRRKQLYRLLILVVVCVLLCIILFPLLAATLYVPHMAFDENNQFRLLGIDEVKWGEIARVTAAKGKLDGRSANEISSGRIALWLQYIHDLNWKGHAPGSNPVDSHSTAHNYFLQQAYSHGILAGITSLALLVYAGIAALVETSRRRGAPEYLFTLTMSIAFGVTVMLASADMIYCYSITFVYFLVQGMIFIQDSEQPAEVNQP